MRIVLDTDRCVGHGRCYGAAPDLFDADEYGHCVLLQPQVPPGREEAARSGVDNCPERALALEE